MYLLPEHTEDEYYPTPNVNEDRAPEVTVVEVGPRDVILTGEVKQGLDMDGDAAIFAEVSSRPMPVGHLIQALSMLHDAVHEALESAYEQHKKAGENKQAPAGVNPPSETADVKRKLGGN